MSSVRDVGGSTVTDFRFAAPPLPPLHVPRPRLLARLDEAATRALVLVCAGPGAGIDIPLAHKDALYVRSHYDGISLTLPDAPLPDEIAIICAYSNRERLNSRVGGLSKDKIKGVDGLV